MNKTTHSSGCGWSGLAGATVVALIAAWVIPAGAQTVSTWTSTTDGLFSESANWDGDPPGATERAKFDTGPHTFEVLFDDTFMNHSSIVGASSDGSGINVTWDLWGTTYTLADTDAAPLIIGQDSDATLTVTSSVSGGGPGYQAQPLPNRHRYYRSRHPAHKGRQHEDANGRCHDGIARCGQQL